MKLIDFRCRSHGSSAEGGKTRIRGDAYLSLLLFESDACDVVIKEGGAKVTLSHNAVADCGSCSSRSTSEQAKSSVRAKTSAFLGKMLGSSSTRDRQVRRRHDFT